MDHLQHDINSSDTRSPGATTCVTEFMQRPEEDDPLKSAHKLTRKEILLIGGWRDEVCPVEPHLLPVYRTVQREGAKNLGIEVSDTDHGFENVREDLYKRIIDWIKS